ncbi:MAG: glycosyltransferase family 39 protein [Acidobacteria bacterium]|nr:glycosyltransferase family 39 protein [Acidobacteriota bacterium]
MTELPPNPRESYFIPENSRVEQGMALLVFAVSMIYLWPYRAVTDLFQDEGIVLEGAQRILDGQVLYRDFFSFYTPGSFYSMALLFKIFGSSYLVARTLLPIFGGLFSLLTYLLARRVTSRWIALLAAYLFLVIGLPYRFLHLHNWDSMVLAYLALYCAVRLAEAPKGNWAFATGTFVSLTTLFEHSKGAGLLIGLAIGFAVLTRWGRESPILTRGRFAALAGGLVWPFIPVFAYFASQGALGQMIADWTWPLYNYSESNRLPYGWINISPSGWEALFGSGSWTHRLLSILFMTPCFVWPLVPLVAILFLALHASRRRSGSGEPKESAYFILVSAGCIGLTLSAVITGRPDVQHLIFAGAPFGVVLAWVLGATTRSPFLEKIRPLLVVYCLVFFSAFGMFFVITGPLGSPIRLQTRRGEVRVPRPDQVIPYLIRTVAPGEKIFVYPQQPLFYFLSGASNPTSFDFFQLGMNSPQQFTQALLELEGHPPRLVVWDPAFNNLIVPIGWPATRLEMLAHDPIRDFILERYKPCTTLGSVNFRYVVLAAKERACPMSEAGGLTEGDEP